MSVKIDLSKWEFTQKDLEEKSIAQILAQQSEDIIDDFWNSVTDEEAKTLKTDWSFWGRPKQFVPEESTIHVLAPGRGFGKTRASSEWVRSLAENYPGIQIGLVGRTFSDVMRTMISGESGILKCCPEDNKPTLKKQAGELEWPNGSKAIIYTADRPDQLRGPTLNAATADELAAWNHVVDESGATAWSNLQMAVREVYRKDGKEHQPQILVTTTPKPIQAFKDLYKRSMDPEDPMVTIVQGTSYENTNLPEAFFRNLEIQYKGTDLFDQELKGGLLSEKKGKLWTYEMINNCHYVQDKEDIILDSFVISVDPSMADNPRDECGIIVGGFNTEEPPDQRKLYVVEDASVLAPPDEWAKHIINIRSKYPNAVIIAERNQGGGLVSSAIRAAAGDEAHSLDIRAVWSKDSKINRASTANIKYKFGKVIHLDVFDKLENQMLMYNPETAKKSPDRLDALVQLVQHTLITPMSGLFKAGPAKMYKPKNTVSSFTGLKSQKSLRADVRQNPLRRRRIW